MKDRINEATWIESRARWQINVQRDGDRRTFISSKPGTKGKVEAEKKADKWLDEGNERDCRFEKIWAAFVEEKKLTTSTSNWKKHDQIGRLWLLPEVKHKRLSRITSQDWQNCVNAAYAKGLSKKTLKNIVASVTAFYKYCKKGRRPLERPEDIYIPRDAPVKSKTIMQPDQLRLLFAKDTIMHYKKEKPCWFIHAWRFEVLTGLRPGEVAGIRTSSDIREQLLQIQRSINQFNETTKGKNDNATRPMKLHRRALDVLQAQRRMLESSGIKSQWAFPGEDGGHMDTKKSYKSWMTFRRQHGITSSLYELRHTFISISKSDMPEQLMKRIVGHSKSMDTFGVYGHEVEGDLDRAAAILDEVWDRIL